MNENAEIQVVFDNVDGIFAKLFVKCDSVDTRRDVLTFVMDTLTYHDKSKEHNWKGKYGYEAALAKFFDGREHTLPIGLIPRVSKYLRAVFKSRISVGITNSIRMMFTPPFGPVTPDAIRSFADTLHMWRKARYEKDLKDALIAKYGDKMYYSGNELDDPELPRKESYGLKLFEHQERIALDALNKRRVSILACTSSGKSLSMMVIARWLLERENKKILIIVPNAALVEQLFRNFYADYGWDAAGDMCTLLHAKSKDKLSKKKKDALAKMNLGEEAVLKPITVSTWQSLRTKPDSFFKVFGAVLVDEAHTARGKELRDILGKCINANNFKVGFSGTLPNAELTEEITSSSRLRSRIGTLLPGQQVSEAELRKFDFGEYIDAGYIESGLGPKDDVVHLRELIANGTLTPVTVRSIVIPYPMDVRPSICAQKFRYDDERSIVTDNSSRKDVICMMFDSGYITTEQNTVILYLYKEHMYELKKVLEEKHPEFKYHVVEGDVDVMDRDETSVKLEDSTGNVLLATYQCLRQGVNITLLHNLVMAEPTKSPYTVIQSIGRIVRKNPSKKKATVFDLVDDASYYTNPRYGGPPRLKYNYMMQHYHIRCKYYAEENIPIEEENLSGIYEAKVTPADIKARRDAAIQKALAAQKKRRDWYVDDDSFELGVSGFSGDF